MNSENIESFIGFVLPTIQAFVFLLVFVGVIVLGPRMLNIDGDLSNSMTGKSLTPYEFLSQVFFYPLHRIGGINLIVYGCGVVMVISFKLFYEIFWQLSGTMFVGSRLTGNFFCQFVLADPSP